MKNPNLGIDKRKSKRISARFTIIYDVYKPLSASMRVAGKEVDALMLDLSSRGMAICTNYDIPASTVLRIKFTLINRKAELESQVKSIELMGEVRYNVLWGNNEHRLGIEFTEIKEEDQKAIEDFVETISSWS
ncbi:MAG: PilZ domain-containing protein [Candidatus Omnitrophica bacterium]|nr:PilZ domain-containing protein [Candidatus Omnitrophota bacterium]